MREKLNKTKIKIEKLFFFFFIKSFHFPRKKKILIFIISTYFCYISECVMSANIVASTRSFSISIISSTILYSIWINYARVIMHEFPFFFFKLLSSLFFAWHHQIDFLKRRERRCFPSTFISVHIASRRIVGSFY